MIARQNGQAPSTHKRKTTSRPTAALMLAGLAALATTVAATGSGPIVPPTLPGMANFIDWDLPGLGPDAGSGACPSAIGAITRRPVDAPQMPIDPVYYVTMCPQIDSTGRVGPSLVELRTEMHPQPAIWRAWNLGTSPDLLAQDPSLPELASLTGGVKLSNSQRVFVRTNSEMLRLDFTTTPVTITRWQDARTADPFDPDGPTLDNSDPAAQSDIALVNRTGYTDVWSTHNTQTLNPGFAATLPLLPEAPVATAPLALSTMPPGIVQRMTTANNSKYVTVTRYATDGGAGLHYLSGIVSFNGKIYYSEGDPTTVTDSGNGARRGNSIGVLDPNTGDVHRFSLSDINAADAGGLPVSGPRQISVDASTGTLWVVTQSGHVVSLKPNSTCGNGLPNTAQMAAYRIPGGVTDPRGVAPATGMVGFSQFGFGPVDGDKVGTLLPNKSTVKITATQETVQKVTFCLKGTTETEVPESGTVQGIEKNQPVLELDPAFKQAQIPTDGFFPLGIMRDPFSCKTAYYFAVSSSLTPGNHRFSRVEFDTDPALPDLPPGPDSTKPGLVTGGGTVGTDPTAIDTGDLLADPDSWAPGGGNSNFGFVAYRRFTGAVPDGQFIYQNKLTGDIVKSLAITSFAVTNNQATFGGTCKNDKTPLLPCTFQVTIEDNGSPGKGHDTFNINGIGFLPNSGTLTGGNIYVHRR